MMTSRGEAPPGALPREREVAKLDPSAAGLRRRADFSRGETLRL